MTSGDFNGDSITDIFVANAGTDNQLLLSNGQDLESALVPSGTFSADATAGDFDNDGFLDIFIANCAASHYDSRRCGVALGST